VKALDEQIAMVHAARDHGWDSLFSGQHYLNEGDNKQLQLVPFLTRLIPEAGDMTTGLGVLLLNLHNPVYTAETVATLDIIARGKFVFGVGLGYRDVEFDAFNVPKDPSQRHVCSRRRTHEHPSDSEAASSDLVCGQQRQGHPARGAHG
jgi:alkanesulfonate monooxygenase SsuD/methylene tetrahydromethanopterin reductase-like flavin-dependent oxidoreductase (luciferase family)